jgi:hypothetical protein
MIPIPLISNQNRLQSVAGSCNVPSATRSSAVPYESLSKQGCFFALAQAIHGTPAASETMISFLNRFSSSF